MRITPAGSGSSRAALCGHWAFVSGEVPIINLESASGRETNKTRHIRHCLGMPCTSQLQPVPGMVPSPAWPTTSICAIRHGRAHTIGICDGAVLDPAMSTLLPDVWPCSARDTCGKLGAQQALLAPTSLQDPQHT